MAVYCSGFVLVVYVVLITGISVHGNQQNPRNLAESDCNCDGGRYPTKAQALACLKKCSLIRKRSILTDTCDYEEPYVWPSDNKRLRGIAEICVQYNTNNNGSYDMVNVSWSIPKNQLNQSADYTDVTGYFLRWTAGNALNANCRSLPPNVTNFILNSSHIDKNMMRCDITLSLVVLILPISPEGISKLKKYNCSAGKKECFLWDYKTVAPTYESATLQQTSAATMQQTSAAQIKLTDPSLATTLQLPSERHSSEMNVAEAVRNENDEAPCGSNLCKYAVGISVSAVVVVLVLLVYFRIKKKGVYSTAQRMNVFIKTSKDYTYVSYFNENTKVGHVCKNAIDTLMNSGLYTVAVNALQHTNDLNNYYNLGPRKFSELYMQNARYVLVLVTKKYLELCDVNNNLELDGETRRVFEEIKYIDRAQFDPPCSLIPEKKHNILPGKCSVSLPMSFENIESKEKQFIAVVVETSAKKLPSWMKGWPIYSWPKDKDDLLKYIGVQN